MPYPQTALRWGARDWLPPALLAGIALAAGALPRCFQIPGQDEILHYVRLGETLYHQGFAKAGELMAFSPHLYGMVIWLAHLLCGPGIAAARAPGVIAWAAAVLALAWTLRRQEGLSVHPTVGLLALLLLASMPLAAQAAAIVDVDNTLLVPAVLALALAAHRFAAAPGWRSGIALASLMALALWCRLTTPAIVAPLAVLYALLLQRRLRPAVLTAAWLALGAVLFLGTWAIYCLFSGAYFAGPFRYLVDALLLCTVGPDRGATALRTVLSAIYLLFWAGPGVVALWAWGLAVRARTAWLSRQPAPCDLLWLSGLAVLCGYCVVGGTISGFPKYHSPAVPLLLIATAGSLREQLVPQGRQAWWTWAGLLLVGAFLQVAVLGDPLLALRVDLREATFCGQSGSRILLIRVLLPLAAVTLLGGTLLLALRQLRLLTLPAGILPLAVGMNAGLIALQFSGGYQTGYNYGDRGDARAVAAVLAAQLPEGATAIVPGEIVYLLDRPAVGHVPNELWLDPVALRETLADERVGATAISLLTNTMAQVQNLTGVASALPAFERTDLGHYALFLRRPEGPIAPGP